MILFVIYQIWQKILKISVDFMGYKFCGSRTKGITFLCVLDIRLFFKDSIKTLLPFLDIHAEQLKLSLILLMLRCRRTTWTH